MTPVQNLVTKRRLLPSAHLLGWFASAGAAAMLLSATARAYPGLAWLEGEWLALLTLGVMSILALLDAFQVTRQAPVGVRRMMPQNLPVNRWTDVAIELSHRFARETQVAIFDEVPARSRHEHGKQTVVLKPGQRSLAQYRLRPLQRGPVQLEGCFVKTPSLLKLWHWQYRAQVHTSARVYPDFAIISGYQLLAANNHTSQLGVRRVNRRGQGMDFHQLREYRTGDSLKQINWKATAYRQKLISKDYQDERDQNVVLLIDSGRRMSVKDDELSHFDHALNAVLVISHIALRQGDNVGVMSFGNSQRWIPPQKGVAGINVILNGLYDLQAGRTTPDYVEVAERLYGLQRKRAMVVVITNSRDEEVDELLMGMKHLQKRHLVVLANLRERSLSKVLQQPVQGLDDALTYCATKDYLMTRGTNHTRIRNRGFYLADCQAHELAVVLANSYWEIKRSGAL